MDDEKTTTRKRFIQKAGLTLAGMFSLTAASGSVAKSSKTNTEPHAKADPFKRIKPAKGAVHREI